mmetsp:Transcript_31621/g.69145  ORF Transcript_31621/g.69145 Transcript_31621/m.69145 type:complete len:246 (+) Transcript_31621:322-1059(+)
MRSARTRCSFTTTGSTCTAGTTRHSARWWPRRSACRCASTRSSRRTWRSSRHSCASTRQTALPPVPSRRRRCWRRCSRRRSTGQSCARARSPSPSRSARASRRRCCRSTTSPSRTRASPKTTSTTSSISGWTATRASRSSGRTAVANRLCSSSCQASFRRVRARSNGTSTAFSASTTSTLPTCLTPTRRRSPSCARTFHPPSTSGARRCGGRISPSLASRPSSRRCQSRSCRTGSAPVWCSRCWR